MKIILLKQNLETWQMIQIIWNYEEQEIIWITT